MRIVKGDILQTGRDSLDIAPSHWCVDSVPRIGDSKVGGERKMNPFQTCKLAELSSNSIPFRAGPMDQPCLEGFLVALIWE